MGNDAVADGRFRDTEIGPVPISWAVMPIADVITEAQYGLSVPMEQKGKYPILRMAAIQDGEVLLDDLKYIDLPEKLAAEYLLHDGDILFNRTNSIEHVGKVGVYRSSAEAVFASYLIRLKAAPAVADTYFLGRLLSSYSVQCRIRRYATPGVQQVNINATNLQRVLVALPSGDHGLEEQTVINRILDAADAVIERTRTVISTAERLKAGLIDQFFYDALGRISSADRPGQKVSAGWKLLPAGDVLEREPKNGISPVATSQPPGVPTFSIAAVRRGKVDLMNDEHRKYVRLSDEAAAAFAVRRGDLLIVRGNANPELVGRCGRVAAHPNGCIYPDILKRVVFKGGDDGLLPEYACLAWNHPLVHNQVLKRAKTSNGTLKINSQDVKRIVIPVPPPVEQQRLVCLVQAAEKNIEVHRQQASLLEKLKWGLMQDLLKGRVRVKLFVAGDTAVARSRP